MDAENNEMVSVTRATCRIQIDVASAAEDPKAHKSRDHKTGKRKCGGPEKCAACRLESELRTAQRQAATAANIAVRMHWRADSDTLDRSMAELGRPPGKGEWNIVDPDAIIRAVSPGIGSSEIKILSGKGHLYTYPLARKVAPDLCSGSVASICRTVESKWSKERFDALIRQTKSPPHFKQTMPIPIRRSDFEVRHSGEKDMYEVEFSILSGRNRKWKLPIRARDNYMRGVLSAMVSGNVKAGELKILDDRVRPGRWYIRVAYSRLVQQTEATIERACALHPGMIVFLFLYGTDGTSWEVKYDEIEAHLRQVQARRRAIQNQVKASNRTGHGRKRTLRPTEKLTGAHERWRETKCQTIARKAVRLMVERKVTVLYMVDFSGIRDSIPESLVGGKRVWDRVQEWPWYQLQQAVRSCAEEAGIHVAMVPAAHTADTCRICGHQQKENIDLRRRRFHCQGCGHKEFLDKHTTVNVLSVGRQMGAAPTKAEPGSKKRRTRYRRAAAAKNG